MRYLIRIFATLIVGLMLNQQARAFSLTGPVTPWMTERIGYGNLILGPMNLTEEYRWNVPVIYYAYSPAFLNYFGQDAVREIEKAIKMINDLPSMDNINPNDYPFSSLRFNYRAQALNLIDVRSFALTSLLNALGLDDPLFWVYTLRDRWLTPGTDLANFIVIKRNFDPDTWAPSSFINGDLWTYTSIVDGDTASFPVLEPVDPLALGGLRNAPVASFAGLSPGSFWTTFTKDDIGGLHYIYHSGNANIETASTNALGAGFGAVTGGGGSPWTPVVGGGGTGGIPGTSSNFVFTALRPGIAKITLTRVFFDSAVGFFISNNVSWVDRYITNFTARQQNLIRPLTAPDILFDAGDFNGDDGSPPSGQIGGFSILTPQDNSGLDGVTDPGGGVGENFGPGQMQTSLGVTAGWAIGYSNLGPQFYNFEPTSLSEADATMIPLWASYDGSTNAPIIYPLRRSIEEIERQVLGGQVDSVGGGGLSGSIVSPWTPVEPPVITTDTGTGGTAGSGTGQ